MDDPQHEETFFLVCTLLEEGLFDPPTFSHITLVVTAMEFITRTRSLENFVWHLWVKALNRGTHDFLAILSVAVLFPWKT